MWTWPVILSLSVSGLALLVSVGALGWQVVSWRRSGPRVKVSATWGFATTGTRFIAIEATNSGRLGTKIRSYGFDLPDGRHIQDPYDFLGQPFPPPGELAPGEPVSFHYSPERLRIALVDERMTGKSVRPYVQTGHGRIRGKPVRLGRMINRIQKG